MAVTCAKELAVKGCFRYGPGDYTMAIELLSSKKIEVNSLISERVEFKDAEEAFKRTKDGKGIKILIEGPTV
jgi:D-xylulose reductase